MKFGVEGVCRVKVSEKENVYNTAFIISGQQMFTWCVFCNGSNTKKNCVCVMYLYMSALYQISPGCRTICPCCCVEYVCVCICIYTCAHPTHTSL